MLFAGGAGGSWYGQWTNDSDHQSATGMPLIRGGFGGLGCETGEQGHSNGGFGGGGGGCQTGGGGGGYIGKKNLKIMNFFVYTLVKKNIIATLKEKISKK